MVLLQLRGLPWLLDEGRRDMAAIHVEQHKYDLVSDLRVGLPPHKGEDKSEKLEHGELVLPREAVPRRESANGLQGS